MNKTVDMPATALDAPRVPFPFLYRYSVAAPSLRSFIVQ
jgi:hypothetical protein